MKNAVCTVTLLALTAAVYAQYNPESDFDTRLIDGGKSVEITWYRGTAEAAGIPPRIGDVPVTVIGPWAFMDNESLTAVTIPDSVTVIGRYAFAGCRSLTGITVASGNQSYASEEGVLYNKAKTKIIYVPKGIGGVVTIANGVTVIEEMAFGGCTALTGVIIPDGVTAIGWQAFDGCTALASVTIPDSVTVIGAAAFRGSRITVVTIPAAMSVIGMGAFEGCAFLVSVTIHDNVLNIGYHAFGGCSRLGSVTIPGSVTGIGEDAFANCISLTSVTFQGTISPGSFGRNAFTRQGDLRAKYLAGGPGTYTTTAPAGEHSLWTKQRRGD